MHVHSKSEQQRRNITNKTRGPKEATWRGGARGNEGNREDCDAIAHSDILRKKNNPARHTNLQADQGGVIWTTPQNLQTRQADMWNRASRDGLCHERVTLVSDWVKRLRPLDHVPFYQHLPVTIVSVAPRPWQQLSSSGPRLPDCVSLTSGGYR